MRAAIVTVCLARNAFGAMQHRGRDAIGSPAPARRLLRSPVGDARDHPLANGDRKGAGRDQRANVVSTFDAEPSLRIEVEHAESRSAVLELHGADEQVTERHRRISIEAEVSLGMASDDEVTIVEGNEGPSALGPAPNGYDRKGREVRRRELRP